MVANKYAFLQITRRRFLNEWEAFKKVISRRNIRRRITIPLTLSNLKLLRRITRTENILHRNFTRRQVAIQNRVASNIGISQSTFSVKVLNLFSRSRDRKSGSAGMPRPISYAVFCLKKKKARTTSAFRCPRQVARAVPTRADAPVRPPGPVARPAGARRQANGHIPGGRAVLTAAAPRDPAAPARVPAGA